MKIRLTILAMTLTATYGQSGEAGGWRRHVVDDRSRGADGVRLADVNGDGLADIATGWEEGGVVRAYLNPGPRDATRPWPAVSVGQVASPEDAVFADLDGDGAADVISCCEGGNRTVYVHWAPKEASRFLDAAAWQTAPIPATQKKQPWMFALPMQVDGRGGIDLIVGSKGPTAMVGWLASPENPRDLAAWKLHPLCKAGWIMSLQAHDMDGDGDADVLISDRRGPTRGILWLENPGPKAVAAGAKWTEHRIGAADREAMFLTTGDLDKNGRCDIVAAIKPGPITWLRPTGDPPRNWQTHEIVMPSNCGTGKGVAIGDIDGDGRNDIVFSCERATGNKSRPALAGLSRRPDRRPVAGPRNQRDRPASSSTASSCWTWTPTATSTR